MSDGKDRNAALTALYEAGAYLFTFTCTRDPNDPTKKSYQFREGWNKKRDDLDTILRASGDIRVGLITGSLGVTACDVDVKSAKTPAARQKLGNEGCRKVQEWAGETPCIVRTPSKGAHLFYQWAAPHEKYVIPKGAVTKEPLEVFGNGNFVELYDPVRLERHLDELPVFAGEKPKGKAREEDLNGHERMTKRTARQVVRGKGVDIEAEAERLMDEGETERTFEQAKAEVERAVAGARKKVDEGDWSLKPIVQGHSELAELWVDIAGTDWRYVPELKQWRRWESRGTPRWEEAGSRAKLSMTRLARRAWRDKKGKPDAVAANSISTTNGGLTFAGAQLERKLDRWDHDPYLLGLQDGTLIDLDTGEVRDIEREDYITTHATARLPLKGENGTLVPDWLEEKLPNPETRDWMQRFLGYCLSGETKEQIVVWAVGDTATGKSTLQDMMRSVLGPYAMVTQNLLFKADTIVRANEKGYELARAPGKRLLTISEWQEGWKLDEAFFCQITGCDPISVREVREKPFTITPAFKLFFVANRLPTGKLSPQVVRRLVPIPFDVCHEDSTDVNLMRQLTSEKARAELLVWCLRGWGEYRRRGLQPIPQESQALLRPLTMVEAGSPEWEEAKARLDRAFVAHPDGRVRQSVLNGVLLKGGAIHPSSVVGRKLTRTAKSLFGKVIVRGTAYYTGIAER